MKVQYIALVNILKGKSLGVRYRFIYLPVLGLKARYMLAQGETPK
jgi:hypothetical protein